jgi:hypothetical protein
VTALIAAGATSGAGYDARVWWVDSDRKLTWRGEDPEPHRILTAIPGDSPVVLVDPWWNCPLVLLANGARYRCAVNLPSQGWIGSRNLLTGEAGTPTVILAGTERFGGGAWLLWAVTDRRQILTAGENFVSPSRVGTPVPGDARILAVRLVGRGAECLTSDGRLVRWSERGWLGAGRFPASDLILAGCERKLDSARRWWAIRSDRTLLVADGECEHATSFDKVPGTADVLTVSLWNRRADCLLSTGELVGAFATEGAA